MSEDAFPPQVETETPLSNLRADHFQHQALAQQIYSSAQALTGTQVITVEGGWSSGKTDLLDRVVNLGGRLGSEKGASAHDRLESPYLLDPWSSGNPYCAELLVLEAISRTRKAAHDTKPRG